MSTAAVLDRPTAGSVVVPESDEHRRERDLRARIQVVAAVCGPLFTVGFFVGWGLIAGFIPVPSPSRPQDEVVAYYQQHSDRIILGLIITMGSAMLVAPFVLVLSRQLKRIEGPARILGPVQTFGGTVTSAVLVVCCLIFLAAAFRPERDPDITLLLNDLGFTMFIGPYAPAVGQCLAVAFAVFSDRRAEPLLPRWVGYVNVWIAVMFLPGPLLFFFMDGPFAWNGIVVFWLPAVTFGLWFYVMAWVIVGAVRREREDLRRAGAHAEAVTA